MAQAGRPSPAQPPLGHLGCAMGRVSSRSRSRQRRRRSRSVSRRVARRRDDSRSAQRSPSRGRRDRRLRSPAPRSPQRQSRSPANRQRSPAPRSPQQRSPQRHLRSPGHRSPQRQESRGCSASRDGGRGRSASRSPEGRGQPAAEQKAAPPAGKYEIEDGAPKANGNTTWRALILVPRPQRGEPRPGVPPGTICIRGPSRPDRRAAEEDGEELEKAAAAGDMRHVREVQQRLTRAQQLMH
uniref:Uncharacterized protein n=1 Tax=Alexandrium monilatum TaxID=311494 RepID=A0A7S4QZC8_9DINO